MNERWARLLLGAGVPAFILATGYGPFVAVGDELPDEVATHFDLSGTPDGSMSVAGLVATTTVLITLGVAACVALAVVRLRLPALVGPLVAFVGGFIAMIGSAILAWTVLSQRGLTDWRDADGPGPAFLVVIALPLAVGAAATWLASALPTAEPVGGATGGRAPVLDLAPGEHAVWAGSLHVRWLTGLGLATVAVGVLVASGTRWWLALPAATTGLVMVSLSVIRVRADGSGLHVRYGLLPWPRTHVTIDRIDRASVIEVRPMEWGGWGYRGSLAVAGRAAVVLRAGPGIRLDLADGKVFVVTVDRPEDAAALLNAESARRAAPA